MTDCERTSLYFDGELPPAEEPAVLDHLAGCARCQAELGDWIGIATAVSRSRTAAADAPDADAGAAGAAGPDADAGAAPNRPPALSPPRPRPRRRAWWIGGGAALAAAALLVLIVRLRPGPPGRSERPGPPAIALAETRSFEPRLTAPAFDRHRRYRVERGAAAHEVLPLEVLAGLERRRDLAGLAAAHLLAGDVTRATAALDALPATAARDSDRAAAALAAGEPLAALGLADAAVAQDPALGPALWNRALALQALDLPLVAAAALDRVAARGEPGWSADARARAAVLRAPFASRASDLAAYAAASRAMLAGTGPVIALDLARRHPGLARRDLYSALAVAGSADEVRDLVPLAAEIDRAAGDDRASRAVAQVMARDFAVRRRFRDRYRALVIGAPDPAPLAALIAELDRAGAAVADLEIGALLRAAPTAQTVAQLGRQISGDDPWFVVEAARHDARLRSAGGDMFGAERALLATAAACRDPAAALPCGNADLDLADFYLRTRRLDEADARLRAARTRLSAAGAPDHEDYALVFAVHLERLRDRDGVAAAYLEELGLRQPERCETVRFVDENRAVIAFAAGDLATARARLPEVGRCGRPPDAALIITAVDLARLGDPADRARANAQIAAARTGVASAAVAADIGAARLEIDADPAAGAARARAAITAAAALRAEPGTAGELRAWAMTTLIDGAGRRGDWSGALAVFGEELGRPPPAGCVVAVSSDNERSTAVVRGADGTLRGSYQPDRSPRVLGADTIVPPALIATLGGCPAIAVIARPPLHGQPDLLPAGLPWAFLGAAAPGAVARSPRSPGPPPSVPSGRARRVLVTDVRPPVSLGLPPLAPAADADAVLVSGAGATPSRVRGELGDAAYVEIHAHGIVDLEASDAAFIALSPDADGRYALTAADVRATRLTGAPIVVLAACHAAVTARYQARRWSLPDAFLASGARAVIAGAAAIPDDQGAALFAELRARLDRGEPAVRAVAALRADRLAREQRWAAGLMVFE